jgi:Mg/Co/Ni transporter MgtE
MAILNPGPAVTANPASQAPSGNISKSAVVNTVSITPASVGAATTAQQTFSGLGIGLVVGDIVSCINPPSFVAGVFPVSATVTASDTIQVTFANVTAGGVVPPAGLYQLGIDRLQPFTSTGSGYLNSY